MDSMPPRQVLPALGDPFLFDDRWPDTPYHSVHSAVGLQATLTWSAIDTLLNDQAIRVPAFRMAQDNKLLPVQSITRWDRARTQPGRELADPVRIMTEMGNGATLVLQGLHRRWPPLRDVTRQLAAEIGHAVSVNAYLTPRSARGFGAHHDPHHAWFAQIEGAKTWQLWAPDSDPTADRPDQQVVLAEGDVLWIPRGWWHAGSSGDRPSLHLTFTVLATKLDDVFRAMVDELAQRTELSRELPPNALRDEHRTSMTVADAAAEITRLIAEMNADALAGRVIDTRLDQFDPLPAQPVTAVLNGDHDGHFHTHPEGILHSATDESCLRLRTTDTVLTVAPEQVVACQALLGRTDTFRLDEIGEPLNGGDQNLLGRLIDARLVCAAACR